MQSFAGFAPQHSCFGGDARIQTRKVVLVHPCSCFFSQFLCCQGHGSADYAKQKTRISLVQFWKTHRSKIGFPMNSIVPKNKISFQDLSKAKLVKNPQVRNYISGPRRLP